MIQILEASFLILEIAPRDHYHGLVSEFMIKSFHEIGLCIRIGIGRLFLECRVLPARSHENSTERLHPAGTFPHFPYILHLQHCGVENIDTSVNLA
jgi:hypothetical protein